MLPLRAPNGVVPAILVAATVAVAVAIVVVVVLIISVRPIVLNVVESAATVEVSEDVGNGAELNEAHAHVGLDVLGDEGDGHDDDALGIHYPHGGCTVDLSVPFGRNPQLIGAGLGEALLFLCGYFRGFGHAAGNHDIGPGAEVRFEHRSVELAALPDRARKSVLDSDALRLERHLPRQRRAIFATSIAETSLTIDGVAFVVDAGLTKLPYLNPATGLESLRTTPTSRASARQRAGRAGRTRPGQCFRLYTEAAFTASGRTTPTPAAAAARGKGGKEKGQGVTAQPRFHLFPDADEATTAAPSPSTVVLFEDQTPPEMQRLDLAGAILQLKALGVDDVLHFDFVSPPAVRLMLHGLETLHSLGALRPPEQYLDTGQESQSACEAYGRPLGRYVPSLHEAGMRRLEPAGQ